MTTKNRHVSSATIIDYMADEESARHPHQRPNEVRRRRLHQIQRRYLLLASAVIGLAAGLIAVVYQIAVQYAERGGVDIAARTGSLGFFGWVLLIAAGSLFGAMSGWLTERFSPEAGGSGIPHVKAVLMNMRIMRPLRIIPVKILGGLSALIAGMSLGREGPTIQIGAAVGQLAAKVMKAPRRSHPTLVAAGAGAGLAAAFNAPLAGFIFVMEELKREMSPLTYGAALLASVCAVAITRIELGQRASFILANPTPVPIRALPFVVLLGAAVGLLGVLFNKSTLAAISLRERLKAPRWLAGAFIGAVAALFLRLLPEVTGVGHTLTENLLSGQMNPALGFVALLLFGKLFLTSASFGTGVPGGIFAPILAMGCLAGYLGGFLLAEAFPGFGISPHVFATIGMAAFLSGSVRAPLTGVVLIFEMTGEYSLLYALLLGAFASYIVADLVKDEPIYEALLNRELKKKGELGELGEAAFPIDLVVEPDSFMDGRRIKDLKLPEGALIVTIERDSAVIVPNGSSKLQYGDHITVLLAGEHSEDATLALHEAAEAP